ncbi:MAG: hypothetical protein IPK93_03695 [Solirubrobacterales bacterium]|nr:hypothetical protein [Solirubrobacterales bacterium]
MCWGRDEFGELGDDREYGDETAQERHAPVDVQGLGDATRISAGGAHTCAIRQSGQAVCMGDNGGGQLGDGTSTNRLTPTNVTGLDSATQISVGSGHSCAVRTSGQGVCWGFNSDGVVGDGTDEKRRVPTNVKKLSAIAHFTTGGRHTCAIEQSGHTYCWGANHYGQIGNGTTTGDSGTAFLKVRLNPTAVLDGPPGASLGSSARLKIGRVKKTEKRGKAIFRVTVKNTKAGSLTSRVKVCGAGPKKLVTIRGCVKLGSLASKKSATASIKVAFRKKAKTGARARLTFTVTAKGAKKVKVKRKVKVP